MTRSGGWAARVGQRVVVRRRLDDGGLTDVVGDLLSAADALVVRTRRGEVSVPLAAVVAGKVVPPRPTRPGPPHRVITVGDLEGVAATHWRAPETRHLGGWLLRAAGGFTRRANSALTVGTVDDAAEALAGTAEWYAARGLPPVLQVAHVTTGEGPDAAGDAPLRAASDAARAAGWAPDPTGTTVVATARTADLRGPRSLPGGLQVEASETPGAGWLAGWGRGDGAVARDLLLSAPAQGFWSVRDGGRTVATARGSLGSGWAAVSAVQVAADRRRLGLARALLAEIAEWAWDRGAASTFLQVEVDNAAARALWSSAGFVDHHRYDYLVAPGDDAQDTER